METINYQNWSQEDIIFQNRNKSYGAYQLRVTYNERIRNSMLFTFLFLCAAYLLPKAVGFFKKPPEIKKEYINLIMADNIVLPKKIEKITPPPKGSPNPNQSSVPVYKTVKNNETSNEDTVKHNTDLLAENTNSTLPNLGIPDGKGKLENELPPVVIETPKKDPPKIDETVKNFAEEMPEFDGGENALIRFLSEHIEYPKTARELGIEGKVMVGFVVNRDGSVSEVKVLRGVYPDLDREASRVVKLLPKFKPGKIQGNPVRVRFALPIKYELDN